MIVWQKTGLDTDPPSFEMATTSRETFTYSLPEESEETLTDVLVLFRRLDVLSEVEDVAWVVGFANKTATVLVDATLGMERDMAYELVVTLVASDADTEPMRTVFPCVA